MHIWILSRLCELLNLHVPQVLDSPEPRTVPAAPQSQTHPQRPPQVQPVSNTHPLAQHAPHRNSPPCTGPGQSWHPSPTHGAHLEGRAGPVPGLTAHLHPPDCHMSTRSSPPPPISRSHSWAAAQGHTGFRVWDKQGHAGTCRDMQGYKGLFWVSTPNPRSVPKVWPWTQQNGLETLFRGLHLLVGIVLGNSDFGGFSFCGGLILGNFSGGVLFWGSQLWGPKFLRAPVLWGS